MFVQESGFIRFAVFSLTSLTSISIFGAALGHSHLFPGGESLPIIPDRNLYAKVTLKKLLFSKRCRNSY